MITVKNGNLIASFNEVGAELKSLKKDGVEYIWYGSKEFWSDSCPVLFPICSGLIDDKYYLGGQEYTMKKHGFAKKMPFSVEEKSENSVTFLLCDNEETFKQYPYHFEFRIIYTLSENALTVKYDIRNSDGKEMYFSVGGHEGYLCPEGIEDYDIILPEKQTLVNTVLTGPNTLGFDTVTVLENGDVLPLDYKYFAIDALVFLDFKGDSVILKNRKTGRSIKSTFKGFPYLLLWTKPNAPYICIEPWCGISDRDNSNQEFETKQGIEHIDAGEIFTRERVIEIL